MARKPKTDPHKDKIRSGRPTKYKDTFPQDMIKYFTEKKEPRKIGKIEYAPDLPTFQEFAVMHCDVCVDTMLEWVQHYEDFSEAYAKCKNVQEYILNKGALSGVYNAGYAKFLAVNYTPLKDKTESTHKGDKDNPLTIEQLVKGSK